MFCKKDKTVWNGHSGEVACDHYHRYPEDVALMKQIGLHAYRLSVSWPRVLPEGVGKVNEKGLDFYDKLIDELLRAGITPYVTLFHWDFPLSLYHRGGWLNRDSASWFADYSAIVVKKLGDRVKHWMTLNEPQVYIGAGHHEGRHAPGDKLRFAEVLLAGHHTLLAHGKSVQAIRAHGGSDVKVGFAPVGLGKIPLTEEKADIDAARSAMFAVHAKTAWTNTWWMDPVMLGHYPQDGLELYAGDVPEIKPGDMETIAQPVDFFGVNIYTGSYVKAGANGAPEIVHPGVGHPITGFDWAVTPGALYWAPKFFYERYQKPIVVTENGLSCRDWISVDGQVHDPQRIDYTTRYLAAMHRAISEGVPVGAYFHWSIMDNFEWAEGYKQRFGMIYVDYPTQKRIPKDSARWYQEVIASNGQTVLDATQKV